MMIIYGVRDEHQGIDTHFRNRADAIREFNNIKFGRLVKYTVKTPISKDIIIAMLNREGWADSIEDIAVKG